MSKIGHWFAALAVFIGSWLSGYFIIMADAWMQHPVAYTRHTDESFEVSSFWELLNNPWGLLQYAHTMCGALITGVFAVSAVGAFYLLERKHQESGRAFVSVGVCVGTLACALQIFPTGDLHGKYLAQHQPATMAAMEGLFNSARGAPLVIMVQPDIEEQKIDNPLVVNKTLSFLAYGTTLAEVRGLNEFPRDAWPTNIPLLYFAYHIMVGLGTWMVAVMALAAFLLWRGVLFRTRWALWPLLISFPFPYIANTAGWITAEVGRQPWLVYGLVRVSEGYSRQVHSGNTLFTLLGFMGLYTLLAILFIFLITREISRGPTQESDLSVAYGTPVSLA